MDFSAEWSEPTSSCFIVADSQDDTQASQLGTAQMLATLKALKGTSTAEQNRELYSPRKCDMPSSQKSKPRAAAGSQSDDPHPDSSNNQQPSGSGHSHSGGAEAGGAGGGGGGEDPGQGGGGGGDGGGHGGDEEEEEEEEAVEQQDPSGEEGLPSSNSTSSGSQPPPLIPAPDQPAMSGQPQHAIPAYVAQQADAQINIVHILGGDEGHVEMVGQGQAPGQGHIPGEGHSSSVESGGISDATTAVVSDTDRFSVPGGPHTSPGRASLSSVSPGRGAAAAELSSAVSTLSSFSSTSSDEPRRTAPRRKAPLRKLPLPAAKKLKLDTSTSPETSTSTSSKKTTTSDTSTEKLQDTSADTSSGDRSHDRSGTSGGAGNISGSQQDMFGDYHGDRSRHGDGGSGNVDDPPPGPSGSQGQDDFAFITPAEKLGSLHFSGQVPETVEDEDTDGCSDIVPPSQDAFDAAPFIIPSSPTESADVTTKNDDRTVTYDSVERPRAGSSSSTTIRLKSVHEWQPSFRSNDSVSSSSRGSTSRPTSRPSVGDSTSMQEPVFVGVGTGGAGRDGGGLRFKRATAPLETQDLELSHIENVSGLTDKTASDADELNLHLTEMETCPHNVSANDETRDVVEVSDHTSSVEIVDPPHVLVKVEDSNTEHRDKAPGQAVAEASEALALHLSQSQPQHELSSSQFEDAEEDMSSVSCHHGNQAMSAKSANLPKQTPFSMKPSSVGARPALSTGCVMDERDSEGHQSPVPGQFRLLGKHVALSTPSAAAQESTKDGTETSFSRPQSGTVAPSLTLDMIDRLAEEDTQNGLSGFKLDRPEPVTECSEASETRGASVFSRAKQLKLTEPTQTKDTFRDEAADPFEFSEGREAQERVRFRAEIQERMSPRKARRELRKQFQDIQDSASDEEVIFKMDTNPNSNRDSSFCKNETLEDMDVEQACAVNEIESNPDTTKAAEKNIGLSHSESTNKSSQAEYENTPKQRLSGTNGSQTQEYTYSEQLTHETTAASIKEQPTKSSKSDKPTDLSNRNVITEKQTPTQRPSTSEDKHKNPKGVKSKVKTQSRALKQANKIETESSDSLPAERVDTPKITKKRHQSKPTRKILHYTAEVPRQRHVLSPQPIRAPSGSVTEKSRTKVGVDPYEFRGSQSQLEREQPNKGKALRYGGSKHKDHSQRQEEAARLVAATSDTVPIHDEHTISHVSFEDPGRTKPLKTSSRQSSASLTPAQQTSDKTRSTGSGSSQVCFHTVTIVNVTKRTQKIVHKVVGGVIESTRVVENRTEELSQTVTEDIDLVSSPSPNRSAQTMTSGDLGDISSISSGGHTLSRPGSAHPSPALLTRTSSKESAGSKESSCSLGQPVNKPLESVKSSELPSPKPVQPSPKSTQPSPIPHVEEAPKQSRAKEEASIHSSDYQSAVSEPHPPSIQLAQGSKPSITDSSSSSSKNSSVKFGSAFSLDQAGRSGELLTKKSSSSTSGKNSESLFSVDDTGNGGGHGAMGRSTSKSSSVNTADSLFSRASTAGSEFVKPGETDIPFASNKRRSSSGSRKSGGMGTSSEALESDILPPSEPEISHPHTHGGSSILSKTLSNTSGLIGGGGVSNRKGSRSEGGDDGQQMKDGNDEDDVSPEIPVMAVARAAEAEDPEEGRNSAASDRAMEPFPPYWPTTEIQEGTPVCAQWRDKHFYHGRVLSLSKGRYSVAFEDGDVRQVKASEIFVCDLLAVGQECLAEREGEDGWQEQATVVGHHRKGDTRTCVVSFEDGTTSKLERGKLSLSKEQVQNLVTAVITEAETAPVPTAEASTQKTTHVAAAKETADKTSPRSGRNTQSSRKSRDTQSKRGPHLRHGEQEKGEEAAMTAIKPKEETYEEFEASPAFMPSAGLQTCAALPVYGKWLDKHFYPGYIVEQDHKSGKYLVAFEDGTKRHVVAEDLVVCDLVRRGQRVYAVDGEVYLMAEVIGHWRKGQNTGYRIKFCEGGEVRLPRGAVMLREEQAAALVEELRPFGTPKPSAADVSLENLVEGKRIRASQAKSSPARKIRAKSAEKGQVSQQSVSSGMASTGGKRKRQLEPKYTSTPTPKRRHTPLRDSAAECAAPEGMVDSPQQTRRSPRKAKLELFSAIKGPLPPHGSTIFQGMAFLLTHVEKTEAQKRREREILRHSESMDVTTTDESFGEDEMQVPFDKDHVTQQLERGGGTVLAAYDRDVIAPYRACVLIASTHQRTLKYIFSLAAGLPCVSHVWVKDCCTVGRQQDYKSYLLPAGISIETNSLKECWTKRNPLRSLTLVVSSRDRGFVDTWVKVLETCGCNIAKTIPLRASQNTVYAVVADKHIEAGVLESAAALNIPVVSSEWVIQCLINAQVLHCSHHPRYKHTFELAD